MFPPLRKYPRTRHIEGSRLQPGDEDLSQAPFSEICGRHIVIEEKVDGAQVGIRFTPDGELWLQSRGHYLVCGSAHEAQYAIVKAWAMAHRDALWRALGSRYVLYGECMQKKHTIFYDALPHYFLEFDILDTEADRFLSTTARRRLLEGTPVVSVPVLFDGVLHRLEDLTAFVGPSLYKTPRWREVFERVVADQGLNLDYAWRYTDPSDLAEGLYIKWEEEDYIVRWGYDVNTEEGRYKWVRADFHQLILDANKDPKGHVAFQPMILNQLTPGADIWSATP